MPRRAAIQGSPSWDELYATAAPQAGLFTRRQAVDAGYSPPLLEYHVQRGRLTRVGRGIFRLTHFPATDEEDLVALWLWSERQSVFSHETALRLHELSDVLPAVTHLTLPKEAQRRRRRTPPGVMLHYDHLGKGDLTWKGPVPLTTALRSILDCKQAAVAPDIVRQAIRQALRRGLFTRDALNKALQRVSTRQRKQTR
jgi:predicted transcriptional regulator of viral defense system